jgi:hypothetical protein
MGSHFTGMDGHCNDNTQQGFRKSLFIIVVEELQYIELHKAVEIVHDGE